MKRDLAFDDSGDDFIDADFEVKNDYENADPNFGGWGEFYDTPAGRAMKEDLVLDDVAKAPPAMAKASLGAVGISPQLKTSKGIPFKNIYSSPPPKGWNRHLDPGQVLFYRTIDHGLEVRVVCPSCGTCVQFDVAATD